MSWSLSKHARERCEQMGVTEDQVIVAVLAPDVTYPGQADTGRRVHVWGDLAVVVNPEKEHVVTVLWNKEVAR